MQKLRHAESMGASLNGDSLAICWVGSLGPLSECSLLSSELALSELALSELALSELALAELALAGLGDAPG